MTTTIIFAVIGAAWLAVSITRLLAWLDGERQA